MADSTTGNGVINRAPSVTVCCVRGIFSPHFSPNPSLVAFNLLHRWAAIWAKAQSPPWAHLLCSLQPHASGAGVILQADSDPGRDRVWSSPLWKCPGDVWGGLREGGCWGSVYIVPLSAPFSSVVTLQACSAHWGEQGKGKWRVMIPAVHVLDADANTAWRGSIGNIFSGPSPL